jgi:hypothetical protein
MTIEVDLEESEPIMDQMEKWLPIQRYSGQRIFSVIASNWEPTGAIRPDESIWE